MRSSVREAIMFKESGMSRAGGRIKIFGLVLAAALAVLAAGALTGDASSGTAADDPCGGHYVGLGLKAIFSASYYEGDVLYESSIINDPQGDQGQYYRYSVPDGDCVFYFRNGHVGLTVDRMRNLRYIKMLFIGEPSFPTGQYCAPNPYFLRPGADEDFWPNWFYFRTSTAYTSSRDSQGKLILQKAGTGIDFPAMLPGDVAYCDTNLRFRIMDYPDPANPYDESVDEYWASNDIVKVECVLLEGVVKWRIRPIAEPFTVHSETKVKNKIVVNDISYSNSLFRTVISGPRTSCLHGTFYFPFELIMERL
jgi:hypothetical protein